MKLRSAQNTAKCQVGTFSIQRNQMISLCDYNSSGLVKKQFNKPLTLWVKPFLPPLRCTDFCLDIRM